MKIVDYDKKMEIIEDFYSQATEIVHIVNDSIHGLHYVNGYNLLDEYTESREKRDIEFRGYSKRKEIEKRRKQLLIELGRAGEYAIKYILLLKQMEEYPNQTIEEFLKKAIYSIGERGVGNTYINQYHVNSLIVENIREEKEKHKLQPLHDYSYLFYILKKLYPNLSNNIYESFILCIKTYYIEESQVDSHIKQIMACFPQCEWIPATNVNTNTQNSYISEYNKIIDESGDAFIRLRYIENNRDNKQYDLNSVLYYLGYLIFHIELIHDTNNVNTNISLAYSRNQFLILAEKYVTKKLRLDPLHYNMVKGKYIKEYEDEYSKVDEAFGIIERNYEQIMKSLNYSQITIYETLTDHKMNYIEMYENIMNNVKTFEKIPQLFCKIPLLLSVYNNSNVLRILQDNGLDINNIGLIDSTFFCIPSEIVTKMCDRLSENGEKLIVDNKLNDNFFRYLEQERIKTEYEKNPNGPPPLPLRRI